MTPQKIAELREKVERLKVNLITSRFLYHGESSPEEVLNFETIISLLDALEAQAKAIEKMRNQVNSQAEDEGLWFIAESASEAYLQQHLRKLHLTIETESDAILRGEGK